MAKTKVKMTPADLKSLRLEVDRTQQEIADYLGVTRETVGKREAGTMVISRETELAMKFLLVAETGQYHFPWRD